MKTIKESDPVFELLQSRWWVGDKLVCEICKTEIEIEESDTPVFNFATNSKSEMKAAKFKCPRCGERLWSLFEFSKQYKEKFGAKTTSVKVAYEPKGFWKWLMEDTFPFRIFFG